MSAKRLLAPVAAFLAACALALPGAASAQTAVPNLPWSELLPPFPSPNEPQPRAVPFCREATPECVTRQLRRMRRLRNELGCDRRGVFATTYLELTRQIREDIRSGWVAASFISPRYLYREVAVFAGYYFRTIRAAERGDPIPTAWRIAFTRADAGDMLGAQDMLLGINAHVMHDMPFVLAEMGLRTRGGRSLKPDHDAGNGHLNRSYSRVVRAVRNRYDASLDLTNTELLPIDDIAGLEIVRTWREIVWRNAERLVNADSRREWYRIAGQIDEAAANEARLIAGPRFPGYGAERDAHCLTGPSGRAYD